MRRKLLFMGDLDDIKFQPVLQDIVDDTVVPLGADNQANLENNKVRITSNRDCSEEEKHRIVEIDHQERRKGKNFMKRIKRRWDLEFPESKRTAQNLVDNARRFKKEGWGNMAEQEELMAEQATPENNNKQLNWTTEMKINVVIMDKEERAKGRGFMKRVKERWDQKYPEYQQASWQKLRDNAARFKKEPELMSLILVRQREEKPQDQEQQQEEEEEQTDFERVILNPVNDEEEQAGNNIEEAKRIELPREELTEEDQDFKAMFITQLENLTHSSLLQMEPRKKLLKARINNQLKESANRILDIYLKEVDTIPEICDKVYAMGRSIGFKLSKLVGGNQGDRKKKWRKQT